MVFVFEPHSRGKRLHFGFGRKQPTVYPRELEVPQETNTTHDFVNKMITLRQYQRGYSNNIFMATKINIVEHANFVTTLRKARATLSSSDASSAQVMAKPQATQPNDL